jgi:hypothetical protein
MEKICFKCNVKKQETEFYKHNAMAGGRVNKCKDCTKKEVKERYQSLSSNEDFIKSERKRGREKYYRLYTDIKPKKSVKQKAIKNHKQMYPEKYKAKIASQRIPSNGNQNHHWSYNEEHWKDVINLTTKQHAKAHRFMVYDQERMMYRTLSGILLDTRESHIKYIMDKIENEED